LAKTHEFATKLEFINIYRVSWVKLEMIIGKYGVHMIGIAFDLI